MATQALYNKWRGQSFDDILGQEHITRTLKNQLRAGRVGHAYLFAGLRGTGKTSTARILAKAVNCIGETDNPPCNQCPVCVSITQGRSLDLIEVDAASNRGIDEIRALRDGVNFSPHESRYKVYVIDEVHMLTNEAFNALLKTLEEPPAHVILVLCTTEPHRLPDTILSRCQRFDFRRATVSAVLGKLRLICAAEGIAIAEDALEIIARRGGGSFRDAESLLDQLAAYGSSEISGELVQSVLGAVASATVLGVVQSLVVGDTPTGLRLINEAIDNGAEPRQFLGEILDHLRALLLIRVGSRDNLYYLSEDAALALERMANTHAPAPGLLTRAIRLFNDAGQSARNAPRAQLPLELAFIETLLQSGQLAVESGPTVSVAESAPPARHKAALAVAEPANAEPPAERAAEASAPPVRQEAAAEPAVELPAPASAPEVPVAAPVAPPPAPAAATELSIEWVQGRWSLVLNKIKVRNPQVRALLNSAYPVRVRDNQIVLACEATFHRDMLSDDKRVGVLEEAASEVLEARCVIQCVVDAEACRASQAAGAPSEPPAAGLFDEPAPTLAQPARPPSAPRARAGRKEAPKAAAPEVAGSAQDAAQDAAQEAAQDAAQDARGKLLDHPAVKRLQARGGQIVKVTLADEP